MRLKTARPSIGGERASADRLLDITTEFFGDLLTPEDEILSSRGGDLKVYDELVSDDQVKSTFQQRRQAVISKNWEVDAASESAADKSAAEFIREQLHNIRFDDVTDKMLWGVFYGYAVAEQIFAADGGRIVLDKIKVRNRRRFRFDVDGNLRLLTIKDPRGQQLDMRYFWQFSAGATHSDDPYGLGLAHHCYWPVYFKRSGTRFWAVFLEKFAAPTVTGKVPAGVMDSPQLRAKALDALKQIRGSSVALVPEDIEVDMLEATRGGTVDYAAFDRCMDYRIAKVVLSQTMTTEAVGGQYKADVHKDVRDEVIKGDADLVCDSFNSQVVKPLVAWNFPGANPPRVWRQVEPEEDETERAERDNKIFALGFRPTEDYIRETYGDGWEVRDTSVPPQLRGNAPNNDEAFSELLRVVDESRAAHRADQEAIRDAAAKFAEQYDEVVGERLQELLGILAETDDLVTFRDRLSDLIERGPAGSTVEKVRRASIVSRLLGHLRGQAV